MKFKGNLSHLIVGLFAGLLIASGPAISAWQGGAWKGAAGTVVAGVTEVDGGTPNRVLKTASDGTLADSLLSDDGTDITLTSGQFLAPDGSDANPSYGFTNSPNSGMRHIGGGSLGFFRNGTRHFRLTGANLFDKDIIGGDAVDAGIASSRFVNGRFSNQLGIHNGTFFTNFFDTTGVQVSDGTAGAPGISFSENPSLGFYRASNHLLGFSSQGISQIIYPRESDSPKFFKFQSDVHLAWTLGTTGQVTDVGLARDSAGVLKVTNGSTGLGDLEAADFIFGGGTFDYTITADGGTQATTFTLPDIGAAAATFATLEGAQTVTGVKTFDGVPNFADGIDIGSRETGQTEIAFTRTSGDNIIEAETSIKIDLDKSNDSSDTLSVRNGQNNEVWTVDESGAVTDLSSIAPSSHVAVGASPAQSGGLRLSLGAGEGIEFRNNAGSADLEAIRSTSGDVLIVGQDYSSMILGDSGVDGNVIALGSNVSTRPALKQSGTTLQARLGDDSAFTDIQASGFDLSGAQTYSESNVSTDRTYDANSTSINELADVVGTLIADLRAAGLVD